jgi:hypothetical protein
VLTRTRDQPYREEDIREWLTAARAVVAAHDVFPEVHKDVLQVRRLAFIISSHGASRDGDGHAVRGEMRDESRDARLVIYRPGSEAESRPKPAVRSRAGTGPNGRPNRAHGPGSGFGCQLPQAQAQALIFGAARPRPGDRKGRDYANRPLTGYLVG